jgi:hypothetical protein
MYKIPFFISSSLSWGYSATPLEGKEKQAEASEGCSGEMKASNQQFAQTEEPLA